MKNKIFIAGLCIASLAISSCKDSFLEIENPKGEPLEEYYTNVEHLNEALTAAYAPLHWPDWDGTAYNALNIDAEILGDDFWVGGSSNTDNEHWHKLFNFEGNGNQTLATLWTDFYSGIKRCNDVTKYVEYGAKHGVNAATLTSIESQARVLRVYYYNILWHYYGNVPFYLENLEVPYTAPQLQADEIYDRLIVELEDIIERGNLPLKWDMKNSGRVSKAMAEMLYAEMAMYQNDESRYKKALDYMTEIIKDTDYDLNPDFADLWTENGEWCKESIWEINYNDDNAQRDWGAAAMNVGGTVLPTLIAPNQWPGGDGWSSGPDGWGFLPVRVETYDHFAENDKRRDVTCWDVRGYSYTERYQDTHIWLGKYRPYDETCKDCPGSKNLNYNNNLRIYRYAETLLNAAELILKTGKTHIEISEKDPKETATADDLLNLVRQRAGLADSKASIDNIIEERHLEFIGEGKRYFDLVRSGKAATTLVPDSYGYRTNSWTPNKKHIPLAQSELDADPTLKQNDY